MQNLQLIKAPEDTGQTVVVVRNEDGLFIVTSDTGEILEQQLTKTSPKPVYVNRIDKYVGIETRFTTQARDAQELLEAAGVFDPFITQQGTDYRNLLDLLPSSLKPTELLVFRYLCEHLTARNYWFGSMVELAEAFPAQSRSSLYQTLKALEGSLIRRCNKGERGLLRITVHPWYSFRGASFYRASALAEWCKPPTN